MSEEVTPEEIESLRRKCRISASLVGEHFEALKESGFRHDEAFELATNYHWALLGGEEEE